MSMSPCRADAGASPHQVLVDVGVGAATRQSADLATAVPGDLERQVLTLTSGQRGREHERLSGFEGILDATPVRDDLLETAVRIEPVEAGVTTIDPCEPVRFMDGDYS